MVLGDIDRTGNPRDPVISTDPVTKIGKTLLLGCNHTDYIDNKGYFYIVQLFVDHQKLLPALYNIAVGKLALHITTGVDCEFPFSQAVHLYDPPCSRTKIKIFKRLLVAKHRMHIIYFCPDEVRNMYL